MTAGVPVRDARRDENGDGGRALEARPPSPFSLVRCVSRGAAAA